MGLKKSINVPRPGTSFSEEVDADDVVRPSGGGGAGALLMVEMDEPARTGFARAFAG